MAKFMNPNVPFVGKMKEQSGNYVSGKSMRALKRGNFNSHKTMVLQVIQNGMLVGGTFSRETGLRTGGGKLIVTSGKGIWHDASAYKN